MIRTFLLFSIVYIFLYYYGDNPLKFESVVDAFYFSATTTTTTGFGDYTPKTTFSKIIVTLHMIVLILDLNDIFHFSSNSIFKKI